MGILNVTPDSFAEIKHYDTTEKAVAHACQMIKEGADIVDVGGESTRPGAEAVPAKDELSRIVPVLQKLLPEAKRHGVLVSVDTRQAETMRYVIELGVDIINDISALQYNEESLTVLAKYNIPVILSHSRGVPKNMKSLSHYNDLIAEVKDFFRLRCQACRRHGLTNIAIDPGLGFAKNTDHNITILRSLTELQKLTYPLCIGWSRKRSIDKWFDTKPNHPDHRDLGSIVGGLWCLHHNVRILRVHNVKDTRNSINFWQALSRKKPDTVQN